MQEEVDQKTIALAVKTGKLTAVSYTHLDVYKRQNDTHPSMVIPELIRLLQERGFTLRCV